MRNLQTEKILRNCRLCPRECGTDRYAEKGFCGESAAVRIARAELHMWEEPCISGTKGSGTVFFSGCNLKCCFCQNYEISHLGKGFELTREELAETFIRMQDMGAHNVNLVNPTHFVPQILDALEWGARAVPSENGGFLQVSGLTYEIHTGVASSAEKDENGMFTRVSGEYRVKNVMVGGQPLELDKTYTLASHNYMLLGHGDGYTMFDGCEVLGEDMMVDNQVLITYITTTLGGVVGEQYANPYGDGRIVAVE